MLLSLMQMPSLQPITQIHYPACSGAGRSIQDRLCASTGLGFSSVQYITQHALGQGTAYRTDSVHLQDWVSHLYNTLPSMLWGRAAYRTDSVHLQDWVSHLYNTLPSMLWGRAQRTGQTLCIYRIGFLICTIHYPACSGAGRSVQDRLCSSTGLGFSSVQYITQHALGQGAAYSTDSVHPQDWVSHLYNTLPSMLWGRAQRTGQTLCIYRTGFLICPIHYPACSGAGRSVQDRLCASTGLGFSSVQYITQHALGQGAAYRTDSVHLQDWVSHLYNTLPSMLWGRAQRTEQTLCIYRIGFLICTIHYPACSGAGRSVQHRLCASTGLGFSSVQYITQHALGQGAAYRTDSVHLQDWVSHLYNTLPSMLWGRAQHTGQTLCIYRIGFLICTIHYPACSGAGRSIQDRLCASTGLGFSSVHHCRL